VKPIVSGLVLAAVAGLVALHAAVLWDRVIHGRLSEPEVGLRWLGAVVLIAALFALRRLRVPLLWGRRALVFWLLVLLLHAGAAAPEDPGPRAEPVRLLFVLPASVAPVGVLLVLLAAQLVRLVPDLRLRSQPRGVTAEGPVLRDCCSLALAPRAPPA
jgi:hypothetical protein